MTKATGDGPRKITDAKITDAKSVQIQNPITGTFVRLDTDTGRVVEQKKSPGPFKGVRILKAQKAH